MGSIRKFVEESKKLEFSAELTKEFFTDENLSGAPFLCVSLIIYLIWSVL